ncbi:hypothetical protein HHK36_024025 [Tetracentron sinense]|uniref:DUF4283 domain-containing protein n=1 Tax=Tetracentron sinense TaxID=13715 RepID=A0A834YU77_TETSI|nr:hypothetical protein HHK36_024025 [Tetracentron sinense]
MLSTSPTIIHGRIIKLRARNVGVRKMNKDRTHQTCSVVNVGQDLATTFDLAVDIEFKKEDDYALLDKDSLLNEQIKGRRFIYKANAKIDENVEKSKLCIKWFQSSMWRLYLCLRFVVSGGVSSLVSRVRLVLGFSPHCLVGLRGSSVFLVCHLPPLKESFLVIERGRKGGIHILWVPEEAVEWLQGVESSFLKVSPSGWKSFHKAIGSLFQTVEHQAPAPNHMQAKTGTYPGVNWARGPPPSFQTRGVRIPQQESKTTKSEYASGIQCHVDQHDGRDRVVIDLDSGSFARWSEAVVCSIGGSERVDNWEEVSKIVGQLLPEEAEITLYPFEARRAIFHSKKLSQLHTLCTDRTYSLGKENFVGFHRWWPASNALSFTSLSKPRWIALKGIPLHLWVPSILKSFGSIYGGLEEVHPSTTAISDLSFAKIRVKGGLYNTPRVILLIFHSITYLVEVSDWEEECCENCRRWPDSMEIRYHRSWVEVAAQTVEKEKTRGCVRVGGSNQNENEISNSNLESKGSLLPRLRDARSPSPRRSEQKAFSQCSQAEGTALSGSISRSKPRSESLLCQLRGKEARGDQTFETARDLLRKITKGRKSIKNQKRNFRRRKQQMRWREIVPSVLQKHNVEDDGVCVELQGSGEVRVSLQNPEGNWREEGRLQRSPSSSSSPRGGASAIQMDHDPMVPVLCLSSGSGSGYASITPHGSHIKGLDVSSLSPSVSRAQRPGPYPIDPSDPFGLDLIIKNHEAMAQRQPIQPVGKEGVISSPGVPTVRKLPRYAEGISMAEPEFSLVSTLEDEVLTSSSAAFNNKEPHRSETEKRDFQRSGSQVRLCSVEIQVAGVEAEEGGFGGKSSLDNTVLHMSECVGFHQGSSRPEVGSPLPPLQGRLWVEDEEGPEEAQSHRAGSVVGQLTSSTTTLMDGGQASEQGAPGKRADLEISLCPIVESNVSLSSVHRVLIPQLHGEGGAESSAKVGHGDVVETPARPRSVSLDHIHQSDQGDQRSSAQEIHSSTENAKN